MENINKVLSAINLFYTNSPSNALWSITKFSYDFYFEELSYLTLYSPRKVEPYGELSILGRTPITNLISFL